MGSFSPGILLVALHKKRSRLRAVLIPQRASECAYEDPILLCRWTARPRTVLVYASGLARTPHDTATAWKSTHMASSPVAVWTSKPAFAA